MIYALKLLVVVFTLACLGAYFFRGAFRGVVTPAEYKKAWTVVLLGVLASYLCKTPVVFLLAVAGIAMYGASSFARGSVGKIAVYLLLACTLPPIHYSLGGFGGLNYIIDIESIRLASGLLLGAAAIELMGIKRQPRATSFFWIDALVVSYQVLRILLVVQQSSVTTLVRTAVEATLDGLLPYFVITRGLRSMADIRFVGGILLLALLFDAIVGVGEIGLQHNLYTGLQGLYDIQWSLTYEMKRGGLLRVQGITSTPILLAFMLLFGAGLAYWLKGAQWRRGIVAAMFGAFLLALVGTFSRGIWLAAGVFALTVFVLRRFSAAGMRVLLPTLLVVAVVLKAVHADSLVMSALGTLFGSDTADMASIEYRRELLDTSLALVQQSPWLGVPNYAAQMQNLRQGEGIIDIVNSYLFILLDAGVVGLALYLLPYAIVLNRLLPEAASPKGSRSAGSRFAMTFVALIIGCLFAIFTSSTFGAMRLLLMLLVAMPTAWLGLAAESRHEEAPVADLELDIAEDPLHRGRGWRGGGIA